MWQFSVLHYHFPIEMHNNFFFFFPLGVCLHGELSGGNTAYVQCYQRGGKPWPAGAGGVHAAVLGLSSSLLGLSAVQRKGFNYEVTPWGTEQNHAASKGITQNASSPFISFCLPRPSHPLSLSQVSDSSCVPRESVKKTERQRTRLVSGTRGAPKVMSVTENFSFGLYSFIDSEQLVQNWRDNSAHTAA